jgi:hypothetical protein
MAKNQLPSVDVVETRTATPSAPPAFTIDAQAAGQVEGFVPRRVEARLTRAQAVILRDKLRKLQDSGAQTADGRFVSNRAQAMQWIIENEVK